MIVGTAGHVDHGKSALVTALTGRSMDRLAEEKRRGITIELNFAPLELPGLGVVGLVDVPGHEDFVRTMVAGASGIDCVLLVVDAQQGIQPQTLEHLAIVEQLGIPAGIPVLAKADLVEDDWLALVREEVADLLGRSAVRFGPPVATSAVTGAGIEELRERIRQELQASGGRSPAGAILRMPVDRAFAVAGAGAVVTGTIWSGSVALGQPVRIEPGGLTARVRTLEQFGTPVPVAGPGARTAIGLAGLSHRAIRRGQLVVGADAPWPSTQRIDAVVDVLPGAHRPLEGRTRVRFHAGTAEVLARVHPRRPIEPGARGLARLVLEEPVVVRGGDRFVLRSYSPATTIGGGRVVDPDPPRRAGWPPQLGSEESGDRLLALILRHPGGRALADLGRLLGVGDDAAARLVAESSALKAIGGRVVATDEVRTAESRLLDWLAAYHRDHPAHPGASVETLRQALGAGHWIAGPVIETLAGEGRVRVAGGVAALPGHTVRSGGGTEEVARLVQSLEEAGLEPPTLGELASLGFRDLPGAARIAVAEGLIEMVERDRYFSTGALSRFREAVAEAGAGGLEIAPSVLRERLGLSRKYLIPLLEWADRVGVTWRDAAGTRRLRERR